MDLEPATYHLKVYQGKTVKKMFTLEISDGSLINLTGYQAFAQIRDADDDSVVLTFSTASGTIALGGALGTLTLLATKAVTALLAPKKAVWELEVTEPNGDDSPLLRGPCTIFREVAR